MKIQIGNRVLLLLYLLFSAIGLLAQKQNNGDGELSAKLRQLIDTYQYDQACLVADRLLTHDSLSVEVLILKGRALAANFQVQQAVAVFNKAYLLDSANATTLFELVNGYRQMGDSKQAIAYCRKIVGLQPESVFFTIQLSNLYYGIDEFGRAKDILLPLYQRDSLNPYVLKQLANSYNELQQADSAIAFYVRYLYMVPYDAGITGKLTNLFIRKRNYPAGIYLTEMFLAHDSVNTGILKLNAYCYYLIKDYQTAAQKFSKCVTLGDKSRFTLKYFGLSHYKQEMYDLAEPQFRLAYQADTTDTEVSFYYGVSAYRSALADTGVKYLEKTLKMLMPDSQFLNTLYMELAGAYTANGQTDTALAILKKAYGDYPDNYTLAFKIAYQYDYYLRKPFQALPYYNEFLKKCPESEKEGVDAPQRVSYYGYTVNRVRQIKGK